jgi:hypothetical protein
MANYARFEIYIPVIYTATELDPETDRTRKDCQLEYDKKELILNCKYNLSH